MQVIEIDAVGLQPPKALLTRVHDAAPRGALERRILLGLTAELGGEEYLVATRPQSLSEDGLRAAIAVVVSGVEMIDPGIEGRLDHRPAGRLVGSNTEVVAPQSNDGDLRRGRPDQTPLHP